MGPWVWLGLAWHDQVWSGWELVRSKTFFLGGTVKKTSGARPIFFDTGTVPNLVFLGWGGEFFNLP